MQLLKPRKKFIRQEIVKGIEDDILELNKKLFDKYEELGKVVRDEDCKLEITKYDKDTWCCNMTIQVSDSSRHYEWIFISKHSGKNIYPSR